MKIAVVGGGITGSVVASELAGVLSGCSDGSYHHREKRGEVVLFDQGRRGPGGRASHRSVGKKKKRRCCSPSSSSAAGRETDGAVDGTDEEFVVLPDDDIDESDFQFDHGCQFFRADSPDMKDLVRDWVQRGWAAPWKARFGSLSPPRAAAADDDDDPGNGGNPDRRSEDDDPAAVVDFFGLLASSDRDGEDVYIGVGGMHLLPRRILDSSRVAVHRGTRVSDVTRREVIGEDGRETHVWDLTATVGVAAFHDTKESEAAAELERARNEAAESSSKNRNGHDEAPPPPAGVVVDAATATGTRIHVHRGFDAVVFTDVSSSFDSWHRASAGLPPSFVAKLPPKLRVPLLSCMIALRSTTTTNTADRASPPLRDRLPFDAFVVNNADADAAAAAERRGESPLWFAARSDSKPGFPAATTANATECWTLVSTPSYAVDEIRGTTMRDPVTGAFRPQEDGYLNSGPGPALRDAFFDVVRPFLDDDGEEEEPTMTTTTMPSTAYLQAQRWGSGFPVDPRAVAPEDVEEICGTTYASKVPGSSLDRTLPPSSSSPLRRNFVADDAAGLYYGGDFCSHLNPGFEAAALSGLDLARHILGPKKSPGE